MKEANDTFRVKIGNDSGTKFFCKSKRLGTEVPYPYDTHNIMDWIISELNLESFKIYDFEVTIKLKMEGIKVARAVEKEILW